ncbi:solute carrier family 52, riboflavin transporter, member 3-A [Gadus chalcogrammus]|uniref:solute carrier family 52, riboflavin transporter, member 3-A n=1 Tax=Gadus chalcogrammus TaxID=1042646 RepID=UPI0024C330C0|nr:solute carrier family 52, riboflavin transporter, member 3-A [Gadus chalcogrammus]XP_056444326.1 solute carrier family 52, riboflavin transporter, member 3-A [Gadus chalcogrammus]
MALLVHLLAAAFGMGSWMAVNGLWVELPLIVNTLPEGWDLPSYLTVIIQLANVGPLLVTLMHKLRPGYLREAAVIYAILAIGVLACVLLAFFWRVTTVVGGAPHSTAFFIITFFLSLVDCTSSVTFLPFMSGLPAKYITTYFIGEGLSGFVPGLVALAQGVGMASCVNTTGNATQNLTGGGEEWTLQTQYLPPNFSPEVFFSFLAAMMCVSLAAFIALKRLPRVSFDLAADTLVPELSASAPTGLDNPGLEPDGGSPLQHQTKEKNRNQPVVANSNFSVYELGFIYFLVVWVNMAANGLLPSVQTYSCMPYGNLAYHLSAALSSVANPVACIVAMFFPNRSLLFLGVLGVLGTAFGSYNMAMAALSPCPLLQSSPVGLAIIVLSWVFFTGAFCYVKVMVGVILRDKSHSALVWCGAASQLGSLVGSVTMFPLVNTYKLFKSGDFCNTKCPL